MAITAGTIIESILSELFKLAKVGIVPKKVITDYIIFDKFQKMDGPRMERYKALGEEYGQHFKTIQKIIKKYEK